MRTLKNILLITSSLTYAFPGFSQPDTVPESIKAPVEFPDIKDLKEHDRIPIEIVDEDELNLVRDMYSKNLFVTRLAHQAINKVVNVELKIFAESIRKDHSTLNKELSMFSEKKRITLADTLSKEKRKIVNELIKETGSDYDIAFIKQMIKEHQELIELCENAIKSCNDSNIREWFESTIPILHVHLDKARRLNEKLAQSG